MAFHYWLVVFNNYDFLPPAEKVADFLNSNSTRVSTGGYIASIAAILLIWFAGVSQCVDRARRRHRSIVDGSVRRRSRRLNCLGYLVYHCLCFWSARQCSRWDHASWGSHDVWVLGAGDGAKEQEWELQSQLMNLDWSSFIGLSLSDYREG